MRTRGALATLATLLAVAGTGYGVSQVVTGGSTPGTAPFWVDTNGGTCTRQPSGAYSDPGACSSFQASYTAASCGDTVIVKNGSYNPQDIYQNPKTCSGGCRDTVTFRDGTTSTRDVSGCVTIQSESTDGVTVNGTVAKSLTVSDPYVRLININTTLPTTTFSEPGIFIGANPSVHGGTCAGWASVHDVMLVNAKTSVINIQTSSYVFVEDSSFGPHYAVYQPGSTGTAAGTSQIAGCRLSASDHTQGDHAVFLRDTWHDYWEDTVPPEIQRPHTECIHWDGGDYGVIADSTFVGCDQYAVSVENQNNVNPTVDYLLVENDLFEALGTPPAGYTGALVKTFNYACHTAPGSLSHSTFRFNSMDVTGLVGSQNDAGAGCTTIDNDSYGNIMPGPSPGQCAGFASLGITFHDNIFNLTNVCGTNNSYGNDFALVYSNVSTLDYTEANGSPSIDYVPDADGNTGSGKDRLGTSRPVGLHKDAGAYER